MKKNGYHRWHRMISSFSRFVSPEYFYILSGKVLPFVMVICMLLTALGLWTGLWVAPADYQQGEGFRIMYVHVPAAFLSLSVYSIIFICSLIFTIWRIKIMDVIALASAPIGATFTLIALLTGAIWGKPMWGTWWVWDARLTSELILLFLFFGYMGLRSAIRDNSLSAKAGAILAMVGMVDIPIIHFSVDWWYTLHQGASLAKFARPSIAVEMIYPLYLMMAAFVCFYVGVVIIKSRSELLRRESEAEWVKGWLGIGKIPGVNKR